MDTPQSLFYTGASKSLSIQMSIVQADVFYAHGYLTSFQICVGFQHLGSRQKQIIAHSVLEHLETIF